MWHLPVTALAESDTRACPAGIACLCAASARPDLPVHRDVRLRRRRREHRRSERGFCAVRDCEADADVRPQHARVRFILSARPVRPPDDRTRQLLPAGAHEWCARVRAFEPRDSARVWVFCVRVFLLRGAFCWARFHGPLDSLRIVCFEVLSSAICHVTALFGRVNSVPDAAPGPYAKQLREPAHCGHTRAYARARWLQRACTWHLLR